MILYDTVVHVFFFKQKTAYEMRISDWSSDVCSSDLALFLEDVLDQPRQALRTLAEDAFGGTDQIVLLVGRAIVGGNVGGGHVGGGVGGRRAAIDRHLARLLIAGRKVAVVRLVRRRGARHRRRRRIVEVGIDQIGRAHV